MDTTTRNRLASEFIEACTRRVVWDTDRVLSEESGSSAVFGEYFRLIREDPEACWLLVLDVLTKTTDEFVLSVLAAGPLEDLVNKHGKRFIARIEKQAHEDAQFRELLCGVWESVEPELRRRLIAARDAEHGA